MLKYFTSTKRQICGTVKPLIKDTPKEDKPPNKGQAESTLVYTLYSERTTSLQRTKRLVPKGVLIKRVHCTLWSKFLWAKFVVS